MAVQSEQFEKRLQRYLRFLFLFGTLRRIFLVFFLIQALIFAEVLPIDRERDQVLKMMIIGLLGYGASAAAMNRLTKSIILWRTRQ